MAPLSAQAKTSVGKSIATATTAVAPANTSRRELTIVNTSANIIDLAFNTTDGTTMPTAVALADGAAVGIRLAAGATWSTTRYKGPVAAIAQTGASLITILEL